MLASAGVAVLPEFLIRADLKSGRLRRILSGVPLLHNYLRLVIRADDPRRPTFEWLAHAFAERPL
jgi:DNA-binding transcriptional LysR family regulator